MKIEGGIYALIHTNVNTPQAKNELTWPLLLQNIITIIYNIVLIICANYLSVYRLF